LAALRPRFFDPWEHAFIFSRDSVATLLAATGFTVLSNDRSWIRAHEFVVARRNLVTPRVRRYIANLPEMFSAPWRNFMDELNQFAAPLGLREFRTWSKIWEYPALWNAGLQSIDWNRSRLLDIGQRTVRLALGGWPRGERT
jgi:hypothetical protein